jgi:hypothetical protein
MKKHLFIKCVTFFALATSIFVSCKKDDDVTTPPEVVSFNDKKTADYYITSAANTVYRVPVGVSTISNQDRVISFTVTSPTNAASGTQYTLASQTVTIPAGQAIGYIDVKGIFSNYPVGRVDTLIFKLDPKSSIAVADYNQEFRLSLQKYCDVDIQSFVGTYAKSFDGTYGPYTINVKQAVSTSATTGYLMIENLWDTNNTTDLIKVELDWTDPSNFKTTIPTGQYLYNDATYGAARVRPVGVGSFSSCANTFKLSYQVYVAAGSFAATVTNMAR